MVRVLVGFGIGALVVACVADSTSPPPSLSVAPGASYLSADPSPADVPSPNGGLRYVALGDSYTIGTALRLPSERWPDQLVARLGDRLPTLDLVANLAVNGFTSRDVIEVELPQIDRLQPDFVTLLIGVNDVVQGVPPGTFKTNATLILDTLLQRVPGSRIVTVATPDYTVTPRGASFGDPVEQSAGIRTNNATLRDLARARGIAYVDTFDLSLRAAGDRTLVADDGLHPSGIQYGLWVERIEPVVSDLIGR